MYIKILLFGQNPIYFVQNTYYRIPEYKNDDSIRSLRLQFHQTRRIIRYKNASVLRNNNAFFAIYISIFAICEIFKRNHRFFNSFLHISRQFYHIYPMFFPPYSSLSNNC